jgi:hypothetical protein
MLGNNSYFTVSSVFDQADGNAIGDETDGSD